MTLLYSSQAEASRISFSASAYLWCALHLALDREEELARLCPACRSEAAEERCPACGALRTETAVGQNAAFDEARFERLKRGESG